MSFRKALSHRSFATFAGAQVVSKIGDSLDEIALVWLVLQQTGDARIVTLVIAASTVPNVLLALPAGTLVDRFDRRRVLIVADLLRGVAVLAVPLFGRGGQLVPVAVGVALFVGTIEPFAGPARGATLPRTVPEEDLDSANALFSLSSSLSRTMYAAGGGVVAFVGAYPAFYVNSVTYVVSGLLVASLPPRLGRPEDADESAESNSGAVDELKRVIAESKEGLQYVLDRPVVLSILGVAIAVSTLTDPLSIITPILVTDVIGGEAFTYGTVLAAIFAGNVLGDIAVSWFDDVIDRARGEVVAGSLVFGGVSLVAAGLLAPAASRPVVVAVAAFTLFGIMLSLATTPLDTLLQTTVPNEMLGRVSSVFTVIGMIAPPVALGATGPLIELFGVVPVLVADGILVAAFAVVVGIPLIRSESNSSLTPADD